MKRHRKLRVSAQNALDITRGYITVSLMGRWLIHMRPPEPYSRPLCGVQGELWDHTISDKADEGTTFDLCRACIAKTSASTS